MEVSARLGYSFYLYVQVYLIVQVHRAVYACKRQYEVLRVRR